MAWEDSSSCSSPADVGFTHKYHRSLRPDITRSGDPNRYSIPGKYWEEAASKEALFEEVNGSILPADLEAGGFPRPWSRKKKSECACPTFREIPLRAMAEEKEMNGGRKLCANEGTFRSRKTSGGRPRAKDMPGLTTYSQSGTTLPERGTSLVGCKAGISSLLFSSVCSTSAKPTNIGQRRYSFGSLGCTSAPDVYLPASATKVVRASADWDSKNVRQKSSKGSRGGSVGATFANHSGKSRSSQRRTQVTPHSSCHQPSAPPSSRRQTTPMVHPDIWCSRGLSLTTDAASFDCVVPTGTVHVCARRYRGPNPIESATVIPGTPLERTSRERYSSIRRGEDPEKISDALLDFGSDIGRPVANVASNARSSQIQGSRLSSGGLSEVLSALERSERHDELSYEQLLMLEATLLLGGIDMYDKHRDLRLDVDNMSYEDLVELGDRIGYVNTGLSEDTIIKCLKKKQCFLESESSSLTENEQKCSICQEEYKINDELGRLQCGHTYHVDCIKKWLLQKNVCPVCKSSAFS